MDWWYWLCVGLIWGYLARPAIEVFMKIVRNAWKKSRE